MKLYVVGIGCGNRNGMTIGAEKAVLESDIIVGYTVYAEQIKRMYPEKECMSTGMKQETCTKSVSLSPCQRCAARCAFRGAARR